MSSSESSSSTFKYVAAPMVDQSDLPFRILVARHGATMVYTQMILADRFLSELQYREFHMNDVKAWCKRKEIEKDLKKIPLIVQLGGNDVQKVLTTAKCFEPWCDGIDLNMGCPQTHALQNGYGASLLFRKNQDQAISIVSLLSANLTVPVSVKLRLNDTSELCQLARSLEHAGASWITLHPRFISCRRRRKGSPFLEFVKELKQAVNIPVISNGGVRSYVDLEKNLNETGADGLMVGEPLLTNPL
ncbi:hypothetical protein DFH28DRAFT_1001036 [Melampsora americana]|nr:hypothetical protein DFH28DRAFT_1001036 [Melampsora americana]